jgi:Uma2 family endonuclease
MTMPVEQKSHWTIEEYLHFEATSEVKHEYHHGRLLDMSGGTYEQSIIIVNTVSSMHGLLKGKPCRVAESNLRVRIARKPIYVYPDLSVVCGEPKFDPQDQNRTTILNPRVVFEVLSESTERYDRGDKFSFYRDIESLEEYMLISQKQAMVESFWRQGDGTWSFAAWQGGETSAKVRSLKIEIPLAEIYAGVKFEEAEKKGEAGESSQQTS